MDLKDIKQELIKNDMDPDDFNIQISGEECSISPRWFYETKQIAKQEDKTIKEDIDIAAEALVFTMNDIQDLAETLVYALEKIDELEVKING